jgi:OmpA-OmpF porin, OOP family
MTRKLFLALFMSASVVMFAQKPETGRYKVVPSDQWEFGLHAGLTHTLADASNDFSPGFGAGIYLRKALDYMFSIRGEAGIYNASGKSTVSYNNYPAGSNNVIDKFTGRIIGVSGDIIMTIANGRFDGGKRTISPYAFMGLLGGTQKTSLTMKGGTKISDAKPNTNFGSGFVAARVGVGVGFRINDKVSFGIEGLMMMPTGARKDYLDAVVREERDIPFYPNARLGFNIGGGKDSKKVAPLWWGNVAEQVNADIAELKKRPVYDPTDTDGDGVIDATDQEKDTPAGARVDTRGVALDSDSDSYPDYKDKEPFSPVGFPVDAQGIAKVPKPNYVTEADVDRIVNARIAKLEATVAGLGNTTTKGGMADWFLPMIHFDLDKDVVKTSEYGSLAAVASVLKSNPGVSIVVSGHTDKLSSDNYNQGLSYRRALNAINTLVSRFGVDRNRLILNYGGENTNLVPVKGNSYMNRRVEFKVATGETEQAAPAGLKMKSYKGNKNAGY